jgi:hypothetical protein
MYRSLDKALQIDGYSLSELMQDLVNDKAISDEDVSNGYIYVLKSDNPNVQHIDNLYKIGHTTGLVAERIKNAKKEATYLFDKVQVVSTFRCFNIDSYNLEQTMHDFFSKVKLDIELLDRDNNIYKPKEWFKVDIKIVEDAINLIIANKINEFEFDDRINQIIKKTKAA